VLIGCKVGDLFDPSALESKYQAPCNVEAAARIAPATVVINDVISVGDHGDRLCLEVGLRKLIEEREDLVYPSLFPGERMVTGDPPDDVGGQGLADPTNILGRVGGEEVFYDLEIWMRAHGGVPFRARWPKDGGVRAARRSGGGGTPNPNNRFATSRLKDRHLAFFRFPSHRFAEVRQYAHNLWFASGSRFGEPLCPFLSQKLLKKARIEFEQFCRCACAETPRSLADPEVGP
jgi:hypothetical protein